MQTYPACKELILETPKQYLVFSESICFKLSSSKYMYFILCLLTFSAKLTARIVVAPDYPDVAPVFAISVKWQSERSALNDFHIQVR